jgi:Stringent starvation protein B
VKEASTTPYLIRAIYEWCCDSGLTPYIAVKVDETTKVPTEYVRNGEIVLNIAMDATHNLKIGNDLIQFSARFAGVSREISVPVERTGVPDFLPAAGSPLRSAGYSGTSGQVPRRRAARRPTLRRQAAAAGDQVALRFCTSGARPIIPRKPA